jgi:4-amino-4-deoxy-L-arabinose transferase-like glycosyltransferase
MIFQSLKEDAERAPIRLLLGIILLTALFLRLWCFVGLRGADDFSIVTHALRLLQSGPWLPMHHYDARIGLYYPLALIYWILGVGEWQTVGIVMLVSLVGVWLAFAIARRLAGTAAGLLAALALSVFPLDIVNASQLLPDLPMGVTSAMAFYLAWRVIDAERPYFWAVAAGLIWGFSYLIKVEAAFLGLPLLWLVWSNRPHWRPLSIVFVSAMAVVVAESLAYYLAGGTVIHRIYCVTHQGGGRLTEEFSQTQLWVFPKMWFVTVYHFSLHYYVMLGGAIWVLATRRSSLYPIVLWVFVDLVWLEFGGNPLSEQYTIKTHLARYCEILVVPMAVLIGASLSQLRASLGPRVQGPLVFGFVFASLFFASFSSLDGESALATKRALREAVAQNYFPLYADQKSKNIASIYLYDKGLGDHVHSLQNHNFRTQETSVRSLESLSGYALLNRGFMEYAWNRYRVEGVPYEQAAEQYPVLYRVDNPGPKLAYLQTRLLRPLARLLPSEFLRRKVVGTAEDLLRPGDAVILKLGRPAYSPESG